MSVDPSALPSRPSLSSVLGIFGLVLAALGVLFAVADGSHGSATSGGAFAPPPTVLPRAMPRPAAAPQAVDTAARSVDPLAAADARAMREREADRLIEQLKARMRAERAARVQGTDARGR